MAKGTESVHDNFCAHSKRSFENALEATNAPFRPASLGEAFQARSGFATSAFAACADETAKLSELAHAAMHESFKPLDGRMQAWMDGVQGTRAA